MEAAAKSNAARRVFAQKAGWLRCSSVEDPPGIFSFVAPCHPALCAKTAPSLILKQAHKPKSLLPFENFFRHSVYGADCRRGFLLSWRHPIKLPMPRRMAKSFCQIVEDILRSFVSGFQEWKVGTRGQGCPRSAVPIKTVCNGNQVQLFKASFDLFLYWECAYLP